MTDRPLDDHGPAHPPEGGDGATRDIRLPPLPPPPPSYHPLEDEPTDRLPSPDPADRQDTLAFDPPPVAPGHGQAPAGPVPGLQAPAPVAVPAAGPPAERERRWPWILLVLLPLVVIAATGLVLALLLGGG